jgi:hypothetical protein
MGQLHRPADAGAHVSLDYIVHCDHWAQVPRLNAARQTVRGLRAAILEAQRTLANNNGEDVCRVFLPKNDWLRPGDEVASVHRTSGGFTVNLNPRAGVRFHRVA